MRRGRLIWLLCIALIAWPAGLGQLAGLPLVPARSGLVAHAAPAAFSPGTPISGADWTASAKYVTGQPGDLLYYVCPAGGPLDQPVWGTTTYTDDSGVCVAAVHAGALSQAEGGIVMIALQAGLDAYTGSTQNGVTSESYGSWDRSFTITGVLQGSAAGGVAGAKMGGGSWDANAVDYAQDIGGRYLYLCPPAGAVETVWGTNTYTDDSSVCTAAVHMGILTVAQGGFVTIQMAPGLDSYYGSTYDGVTSAEYGSWLASFIFPGAVPIPGPSATPGPASPTATATPRSIAKIASSGTGPFLTWSSQLSGTSNWLESITCASSGDCVAVGLAGTIVTSADGAGATWTVRTAGTGAGLNGVSCNGSTCVAVGHAGALASSADGGASWISRASGTTQSLYGVACPTSSACLAVGYGGTILASTDGGVTWTGRSSGTGQWLVGITCLTSSTCLAVGYGGTILASTDSGATWSSRTSGTQAGLLDITCSGNSCLTVGDAGTILASTDSGATWSSRTSGTTADLHGVVCATSTTCLAVGATHSSGVVSAILVSADSGATWSSRVAGTSVWLLSIACPLSVTCIAVGANGTILAGTGQASTTPPATVASVPQVFVTYHHLKGHRAVFGNSGLPVSALAAPNVKVTFTISLRAGLTGAGSQLFLSKPVATITGPTGLGGAQMQIAYNPPAPLLALLTVTATTSAGTAVQQLAVVVFPD